MKGRRKLMKRILAAFTALLILFSGFYANAERNGSSSPKIGENISGFVSETIYGESISGAIFTQKKITVLHYFSTWSAVCINEMEYMQTAADGFPDDVGFYGFLYEDATRSGEQPNRRRECLPAKLFRPSGRR